MYAFFNYIIGGVIIRSVMSHLFSQIPRANIQRSSFDRSRGYKTTFNSGLLIPIFCDEVLPGDSYSLKFNHFTRMATPAVPIMDNMYLDTQFFFIPSRLLWDNWERFCGAKDNPDDSNDFIIPTIKAPDGGFQNMTLADYFAIPTRVSNVEVNALPFRAYNLCYNEWYRAEQLQDSVPVPKGDSDDASNYVLLRRGKRHDAFTSCLPYPQEGPGVNLPIGTTAPVYGDGNALFLTNGTNRFVMSDLGVGGYVYHDGTSSAPTGYSQAYGNLGRSTIGLSSTVPVGTNVAIPHSVVENSSTVDGPAVGVVTSGNSGLYADLTSAMGVTISTMRTAFQLQKFYEAQARSGGGRYVEILMAHFNVISPDARLQRPEYLGGGTTRININPVAQTSSTNSTTPQGNLAAFGVSSGSYHGFTKSFVEHGYILGLMSVRADLTYQQGLDRMWSRRTMFDFYWPTFAHLSEEPVLNETIYCQGTAADKEVFGYQERYYDYRYAISHITGKFRSNDPQSLDVWHLAQNFDSLPTLSADFIEDKPPISRVVAVTDEPEFLFDGFFDVKCTRPMPVYGVPGLIDHF